MSEHIDWRVRLSAHGDGDQGVVRGTIRGTCRQVLTVILAEPLIEKGLFEERNVHQIDDTET